MNTRYDRSDTPLDSFLGGVLVLALALLPLWSAIAWGIRVWTS
ncbi:MAG: hypothetical protein ABSF50_08815 [Burkholderiaceae bacterium]